MKKIFALSFLLFSLAGSFAQESASNRQMKMCYLENLSSNYDYNVTIRWGNNDGDTYAKSLQVTILHKTDTLPPQSVEVHTANLFRFYDEFSCEYVRSYATGVNADMPTIDYDYGNFVVRDFNFDGKEDFAVKVSDNNAGAPYEYYMNHNGKFERDPFLSDSVSWMVDSFDAKTKQAFMSHNSGCCTMMHYTYKYNAGGRAWALAGIKEENLGAE